MHLNRGEWFVRSVPLLTCRKLVEEHHYARGGSNTATHRHGLFRHDDPENCRGVAWWIPPTKGAAQASFPAWRKVLSLSRLVLTPDVPTNGASFLIAASRKLIPSDAWPCLITYADDWRGHEGTIYKADNWEYVGKTKAERTYTKNGVLVARKAGPKTRTHDEMTALGAAMIGSFAKHKFRYVRWPENRDIEWRLLRCAYEMQRLTEAFRV